MKRNFNFILLGGVLAGVVAASQAAALAVENSYLGAITNRNLFQLKSPKPENVVDPRPPQPLRVIKLSGITRIFDKKIAVLRVPRNARPPEPAEVSLLLGEGAPAEEGVRVLEINVSAGTVRIMNGNTEQWLDIMKNAPQTDGGSAVPRGPAPGLGLPPAPARATVMPVPSVEEQTIMMEVNRERTKAAVARGELPPLPPTELSEAIEQEQ